MAPFFPMRSPTGLPRRRLAPRRPSKAERTAAATVSLAFFLWVVYQVTVAEHPRAVLPHSKQRTHRREHVVAQHASSSSSSSASSSAASSVASSASPTSDESVDVDDGADDTATSSSTSTTPPISSVGVGAVSHGGAGSSASPTTTRPTEAEDPEEDELSRWRSSGRVQLSCPRYSGPGWRRETPVHSVSGAREAVSVDGEGSYDARSVISHARARTRLDAFPLASTRLARGASRFSMGETTNLAYLNMLDPERLVWAFRREARLPTGAGVEPYTGWEHPGSELRGHFVGHYLSASAMATAVTGDVKVTERSRRVLEALAACQRAHGDGYLAAFPSEFFDRFEQQLPVWAPYYTLHKLLQGLLDQYIHARRQLALDVLVKLVEYVRRRTEAVVAAKGLEWWRGCLNMEYGGMNDVLYALYRVTSESDHLRLAKLFDKPCFTAPLAAGDDPLAGLHANTHLPLVVGAATRYEVTGEAAFGVAVDRFFSIVNDTRRFATGGTSHGEVWVQPRELGHLMVGPPVGTEHQESCTTYNMVRVAGRLLTWRADARHADFVERALVNGILGTQRGHEPGVMLYTYPLGAGVSKAGQQAWRAKGWGTPFGDFWCCYGTLIESFAKLTEGVFFHSGSANDGGNGQELWLAQPLIPTRLRWEEAGLEATVTLSPEDAAIAAAPLPGGEPLVVTLTLSRITTQGAAQDDDRMKGSNVKVLHIRVPTWAATAEVSINGGQPQPQSAMSEARARGWMSLVKSTWSAGDTVRMTLTAVVRQEKIADRREEFRSLTAIMYGPHVLGGLTAAASSNKPPKYSRRLAPEGVTASVTPVPTWARSQLRTLTHERGGSRCTVARAGDGWDGAVTTVTSPSQDEVAPWRVHRHGRGHGGEGEGDGGDSVGGTDAGGAMTWRMVPEESELGDDRGGEAVVRFESFDRPGVFIGMCPSPGNPVELASGSRFTACLVGGDDPTTRFRLVPETPSTNPLDPAGAKLARIESAGPGENVQLCPSLKEGGDALRLAGVDDEDCDGGIVLEPPVAQYPLLSFWATGGGDDADGKTAPPRYLFVPLNEIVDEAYNVYWE